MISTNIINLPRTSSYPSITQNHILEILYKFSSHLSKAYQNLVLTITNQSPTNTNINNTSKIHHNHNTRTLPIQESMDIIQIKSPAIYQQYQLKIIKLKQLNKYPWIITQINTLGNTRKPSPIHQ